MSSLDRLFQQFLQERTYLQNVSPRTIQWYESAWGAFRATQSVWPPSDAGPLLARAHLTAFIVSLRRRGVKPVSCNTWSKAINAFCLWLHKQGAIPEPLKIDPLRVERRLIKTLDDAQIRNIVRDKPETFPRWRIHALACTILDTGCRIEELLTAPVSAFDMDNMLLTVVGEGEKERKVPFSPELRKVLFRYSQWREKTCGPTTWMFAARTGGTWGKRAQPLLMLKRLGLPKSGFHLLRHTFATQYLRAGGDVVRLSKTLGHTQISTTMRHLPLLIGDLQVAHRRISILERIR